MSFASIFPGRNAHRVDVPVIGDSITSGLFASQYANIWVQKLTGLMRAAYPTVAVGAGGGLGWIPVNNVGATDNDFPSWPVNDLTGAESIDLGPIRGADLIDFPAGGNISFTAPTGTTSVQPTYFDADPSGSMTVAKNAVTQYTINNAATLLDIKAPSVPMTGGDVLTITFVSGHCVPTGILHYAGDENSGITFHAMGRAGWTSGTQAGIGWNVPENLGGLNWAQGAANSVANPLGLIICLGANDATVYAGNRTAAQFQSDLAALLAVYRGSTAAFATCPVLLIGEYEVQFRPWADPSGLWASYFPAIAAVAAADGNAQAVNLAASMPSAYTVPFPSIYYPGEDGHPNDAGELVIAQNIFGSIGPLSSGGELLTGMM